ncbi:MAG: undecaprenyl-diphosphate phosphatase [Polyangiaceae bacterium]|nr:undecaprenyl-diphosphate phosphatase [Polyangiaceae bacterium]
MDAPVSSSIVLGVIQGITEFLPISSDGHLALAELVLSIDQAGLTLNVMLHAGTLLATLIVLRRRVMPAVVDGTSALIRPSRFTASSGGRDALVVIVASLPTAIIGLALRDAVERWTHSPTVIGLGFLGTAAVVLSTRFVRAGEREVPTLLGALVIGLCQGLAVLPGLSRSGSTIAAALWLKVRPDRAFELSMLMSLPAVTGAIVLEARHLGKGADALLPAVVGASVALAVGVVALMALRRIVMRGHFAWFAAWVAPLGLVSLLWVRPPASPPPPAAPVAGSATPPNRDSSARP